MGKTLRFENISWKWHDLETFTIISGIPNMKYRYKLGKEIGILFVISNKGTHWNCVDLAQTRDN